MRPISFVLRGVSPLLLAREAAWRTSRRWKRSRLASELKRPCPALFHPVGYYRPQLDQCPPPARDAWIDYADAVCAGRFSVLGYPPSLLGFPPRWDVDFVSGKSWPLEPSGIIQIVRHDGSDVKVPWELSRLQFLPVLGKAWKLTGDSRYRTGARDLLADWISKQPVGVGVNWTVPMEAALRAVSICLSLELFWPFSYDEQIWLAEVTRSLWHHFKFIESQIEFSHIVRSNHYFSNLVGLFCLSVFLHGGGSEARRKRYAHRIESEVLHQVYADGGDYEASTGYHVLVGQMLFVVIRLMRAAGIPVGASLLTRLRDMYRVMAELADPSGRLPHVGDCDDGRVELLLDDVERFSMKSGRDSLTISSLLGFAAALLEEPSAWRTEDLVWFSVSPNGLPAANAVHHKPERSVRIFAQSGIGIVRQRETEALFLAMPNGIEGRGSHTHNDKLSLILRVSGEELLRDCGTCCYSRDAATRNHFRSTGAHNTVIVDDQEQNRIDARPIAIFCLADDAHVSPIESREHDGTAVLSASHSGYQRVGVVHKRTLQIEPNGYAQIDDCFTGGGRHKFQAHFHLGGAWKVAAIQTNGTNIRCQLEGPQQIEMSMTASVALRGWSEPARVSSAYGVEFKGNMICVATEAQLPLLLHTSIRWER
jgi:Heparinase II/III-like protein/Heparinase II/III N-terminus